jgi:tetratricopeptide (TPR) repeat protein
LTKHWATKRQTGQRGRMLPLLLAFLGLMFVILFATRWFLFRRPVPPNASATNEVRLRYWQDRVTKDVSNKEAYLQLGLQEERAGLFTSARRHLGAARTLGVADKEICSPLGRVLVRLGQFNEAQRELEKAILLEPQTCEPVMNLAGLYVSDRQIRKAEDLLVDFWRENKKGNNFSQDDLERLLMVFQQVGNDASALEVGKYLVTKYPNDAGSYVLAAQCAFTMDDIALAKNYTEKALKETPNESAALYFYGLVLHRAKDYDGALKAWQKANTVNPTATDVYERIGEEYARRGDFQRAAHALEFVALKDQTLQSSLKTSDAYGQAKMLEEALYWQTVATGLQGDYPKALKLAQSVSLSTNPLLRRRGLNAIAEAYRGMRKKKEYLIAILEATREGTADDWLQRARAYAFLQESPLYIESLHKVIEKDPKREAEIRYQLGTEFIHRGERDKAEKELESAIQLKPENATFLLELAKMYMKRSSIGDRLSKATKLARQVTSLSPDDESAWLILGQCYAGQNNLGQAAQCIEHAIDLEAGNGPAYLELSRVYARAGNTMSSQEAMKQYQKYATFEQNRQTLRTKARRPHATIEDMVAYANISINLGDTQEAMTYYENAYLANPQDKKLLNTLRILYKQLQMPNREKQLEQNLKQKDKTTL